MNATRIYGWLQVEFGASDGNYDPRLISFTYDNAATGTTPFIKPIGGFVVPEPSSAALLALGAAGVLAQRRRRRGQAAA